MVERRKVKSAASFLAIVNALASSTLLFFAIGIEHRLTDLETKINFIMTVVKVQIKNIP